MIIGPQDEGLIDVIDDRHEMLVPDGIQGFVDRSTSIHLTRSELAFDVWITCSCAAEMNEIRLSLTGKEVRKRKETIGKRQERDQRIKQAGKAV